MLECRNFLLLLFFLVPTPPVDLVQHYNEYWDNVFSSYPHYPTIRHRKRFIFDCIASHARHSRSPLSIFDFGCGDGALLQEIQRHFHIDIRNIGGCDISPKVIERARSKMTYAQWYAEPFPPMKRTYELILCSEVLEHTPAYREILQWIHTHLSPGGEAIITTQTGKIHASDLYTGHTQHFTIGHLRTVLEELDFEITYCKLWGFPFFTLQKYLTDVDFERVKNQYLEGGLTLKKRMAYSVAYAVYFLHDLIPFGPQIYITARKR